MPSSHISATLSVTSVQRLEAAEAEQRVLEEQVHRWLEALFGESIPDLWAALATGAPLCKVLVQLGEPVKYRPDATAGTFYAVDNIAQFLSVCAAKGIVPPHAMFETEDLTELKNPRQVLLCLLQVAQNGICCGLPAPALLREELAMRTIQSRSSLSHEDIQRFIQEEDEARRQPGASLLSAVTAAPTVPSGPRVVPSVPCARSPAPTTTQHGADSHSVGPSSTHSLTPPRRASASAALSVTHRTTTAVRTEATEGAEGKLTLTLDVDYNLVLRAMQLKHEEQMASLKAESASQLEEMEALHRRGMLALGQDLDAKHRADAAQREAAYAKQVAALTEQQASLVASLKAAHAEHVLDVERALKTQHTEDLARQEEHHRVRMGHVAEEQVRVAAAHASSLEQLRAELTREQKSRMGDLERQHAAQVEALGTQHRQALEAEKRRVVAERRVEETLQLESQHRHLAEVTRSHREQLEVLKREREAQAAEDRAAAQTQLRESEVRFKSSVETLRTTHTVEVRKLLQQSETAAVQKDAEKERALARLRQQLEETHQREMERCKAEHEIELRRGEEVSRGQSAAAEGRWAEAMDALRRTLEAEKAKVEEEARGRTAKLEQQRDEVVAQNRLDKESLASKYEEQLREAELQFKLSLEASLQREAKRYAVVLASERASHAEELYAQAVHQRKALDGAVRDAAAERLALTDRRAADHRRTVAALQDEHDAHLRWCMTQLPEGARLPALLEGEPRLQGLEAAGLPPMECAHFIEQSDELKVMITTKLSSAQYNGIHLYHCRPRGSFFLRKGPTCTPEFFVRQFGESLMAFVSMWVELDSFIQQSFDVPLQMLDARPPPSRGPADGARQLGFRPK